MAWSELKRKQIWGKKFNPAIVTGMVIIAVSVLIGGFPVLVFGLFIWGYGLSLRNKHRQKMRLKK